MYSATIPQQTVPWSQQVTFPKLDPNLGFLRNVRVSVTGFVYGTLGVENTDPAFGNSGHMTPVAYVAATLPSGGLNPANPAFESWFPSLAAYDGVTDYAEASGESITFGPETGTGAPTQSIDLYQLPHLSAYTGPAGSPGTITIGLAATNATNGPPFPAVVYTLSLEAKATISLRYDYDPAPAVFCYPNVGFPPQLCPCNNVLQFSSNACSNSVSPAGATLSAQGQASLASDTLKLTAQSMPNTTALFVQANSFTYGGFHYGDGMNCMSGPVVRLATKAISGGSAEYPMPGDNPISVQGQVISPGTPRYYQVLYRDPGSVCGNGPFNLTSGIAVLWHL